MRRVLLVLLAPVGLLLMGCESLRNYRPTPYAHTYLSKGKYTNAYITTTRWK
jgi:hypothetical protein